MSAGRVQFERLNAQIQGAGDTEDDEVDGLIERLFWDARGHHCKFGLSSPVCGGPQTSWPGKPGDANKPSVLVKKLDSTAKGCKALIEHWRSIGDRVENGLEVQAHDRLKLIRMLGRQPIEAIEDQRVWLIFVASFARHPLGKDTPFDDLKSDMDTPEFESFLKRLQSRWPRALDGSDAAGAKQVLLDLVARNVERLEAKLEAHLEHADELAVSAAASKAYDESAQGVDLAAP